MRNSGKCRVHTWISQKKSIGVVVFVLRQKFDSFRIRPSDTHHTPPKIRDDIFFLGCVKRQQQPKKARSNLSFWDADSQREKRQTLFETQIVSRINGQICRFISFAEKRYPDLVSVSICPSILSEFMARKLSIRAACVRVYLCVFVSTFRFNRKYCQCSGLCLLCVEVANGTGKMFTRFSIPYKFTQMTGNAGKT